MTVGPGRFRSGPRCVRLHRRRAPRRPSLPLVPRRAVLHSGRCGRTLLSAGSTAEMSASGHVAPNPEELSEHRFIAARVIDDYLVPALGNRVRHALSNRGDRLDAYADLDTMARVPINARPDGAGRRRRTVATRQATRRSSATTLSVTGAVRSSGPVASRRTVSTAIRVQPSIASPIPSSSSSGVGHTVSGSDHDHGAVEACVTISSSPPGASVRPRAAAPRRGPARPGSAGTSP